MSLCQRPEIYFLVTLMLDVMAETLHDGPTTPLGRPVCLRWEWEAVVRWCLTPSMAETASKSLATSCLPLSVSTYAEGVVDVHPMVRKMVGDNGGRGSAERCGATQLKESVSDYQYKLMFTLHHW